MSPAEQHYWAMRRNSDELKKYEDGLRDTTYLDWVEQRLVGIERIAGDFIKISYNDDQGFPRTLVGDNLRKLIVDAATASIITSEETTLIN